MAGAQLVVSAEWVEPMRRLVSQGSPLALLVLP